MLNELIKLFEQKKFISIYTNDQDVSKFYYGQILSVNENEMVVYMISPHGTYDGIMLKKTKTVFRVEVDGQYELKMQKLCSLNSNGFFDEKLNPNNLKLSLLQIAHKARRIISIELLDSGFNDVVGFVTEVQGGLCKLQVMDEYGYKDGKTFVCVDDITQIRYASEDEERILKLYVLNYTE